MQPLQMEVPGGIGQAAGLSSAEAPAWPCRCSCAQASASQLFADWEQHCQRQQGDDHDAHHPGHAALLVPGQPAGSEELGELEGGAPSGGPAAAATLDGELLGDEVELRSWRRRLRCGPGAALQIASCVAIQLLPQTQTTLPTVCCPGPAGRRPCLAAPM